MVEVNQDLEMEHQAEARKDKWKLVPNYQQREINKLVELKSTYRLTKVNQMEAKSPLISSNLQIREVIRGLNNRLHSLKVKHFYRPLKKWKSKTKVVKWRSWVRANLRKVSCRCLKSLTFAMSLSSTIRERYQRKIDFLHQVEQQR